ncbi:MAG: hypothetical protein ACR2F8_04970 [Caulobacteraceae bacterium]
MSLLLAAGSAGARDLKAQYPSMAPSGQYLIAHRSDEVALARGAAPPSISQDAGVMILGVHGFETVAKGANGFVCIVERAWDKSFGDPEFWNPKMRGPVCLNAAAVRSVLPILLERARWALSGLSMVEMKERARTSATANMTPEPGAMSFMMSKEQYLSDSDRQWHPHVMFFSSRVDPSAWGANVKASPVLADPTSAPFTLFFIPVRKWSDGTLADYASSGGSSSRHQH